MGNNKISRTKTILSVTKTLPYFTLDDLASVERDKSYLKIVFSRYEKRGTMIRLKKGMYVTRAYVDMLEKSGRVSLYAECLAGVLYAPSYLSLEYVLHRHGVLTESPVAVTAVSKKKTTSFATPFGRYQYHTITPALFTGYERVKEGDFLIYRATIAKALFDFLYFRKRHLSHPNSIKALRLNVDEVALNARRECGAFAKLEGSARMKMIIETLFSKK